MLEKFECPDGETIKVAHCLDGCRMQSRCMTLPTLKLISQEREWAGVPSTTQLLNGTMMEFLKLTKPYTVVPDSRTFMLAGTRHHKALEEAARELGLASEVALNVDRDIFDLIEIEEDGSIVLTDYKLWGSYKVAKAIGLEKAGKVPDPSGAVYAKSGKWGKAGTPKMIDSFAIYPERADNMEANYQLNRYRVMLREATGVKVNRMQLQVTIRDGGTITAKSRGLLKNSALIPVPVLDDEGVKAYFTFKTNNLLRALREQAWTIPCSDLENWEGRRCQGYCDVAVHCPLGQVYSNGNDMEVV
ncbi:MAG: hypothetical protein ACWGQW_00460 [bacterium]